MTPIDTAKFQVCPAIEGETKTDTKLLRRMAGEAKRYVMSFRWAPEIERQFLAYGVGGVLAVFLFRFSRPVEGSDDRDLWVIVGDLPPAYFVTDDLPDPAEALDTYCEWMEEWADKASAGADVSDCYPVRDAPTPELGRMLKWRVDFIRNKVIPDVRERLG